MKKLALLTAFFAFAVFGTVSTVAFASDPAPTEEKGKDQSGPKSDDKKDEHKEGGK